MTDRLTVLMSGCVAAHLTRTDHDLHLVYDRSYQARAEATPISLSLPLQVDRHESAAVKPWIAGLLPDNPDVLRRWAREFETSSSPFDLLSTPIGEDCAGAVQFVAEERVDEVIRRPGQITWLTEDDVAGRLVALRSDTTAWLGPDFAGRFSLAGAQAKMALFFDGSRWGLPSGSVATTHILKPAIAGLDDHDLNEHICLAAARSVGLVAARTTVAQFVGETALVVERYDRVTTTADELERVHQEDLCQALRTPPDRKYEADGGPTAAMITSLLRDVVRPAATARRSIEAFVDALIWNWIIAGTDAHAKNYSVLLAPGQVRLAPLYDLASALAYPGVDELKLKSAMKLGGDYRLKAHRASTWPKVARSVGADPERTVARVLELIDRAPDAFAEVASAPEVQTLERPLPGRLVDAVAGRAKRCAQQVADSA